jgi:hypothetical protein
MPEIGTSGSMSGDGKRSVGHRPQVTAPILNSTIATNFSLGPDVSFRGEAEVGQAAESAALVENDPTRPLAARLRCNAAAPRTPAWPV